METSQETVLVTCIPNGPARIQGKFELQYPNGEKESFDGTLALCRCGQSAMMPRCDGSHKNCVPGHDGTP